MSSPSRTLRRALERKREGPHQKMIRKGKAFRIVNDQPVCAKPPRKGFR